MPVETELDVERGIAIRRVVGEFTAEAAVEAMKSSYSQPGFVSGMNSLWDLRRGDISGLPTFDLRKIVWFATSSVDKRGRDYRTALVASDDEGLTMMRLLKILGSNLPGNIRVFDDYDEALAWASEPGAEE